MFDLGSVQDMGLINSFVKLYFWMYQPAGASVETVLNLVGWRCGAWGRLILWQNWF